MAGRPRAADPKVTLSLTVRRSTVAYFEALAENDGLSVNRYLADWLEAVESASGLPFASPANTLSGGPPSTSPKAPKTARTKEQTSACSHPINRRMKGTNMCMLCGQVVKASS